MVRCLSAGVDRGVSDVTTGGSVFTPVPNGLVELAWSETYEFEETAADWRSCLARTHGRGFAYSPVLQSLGYLREAARVWGPRGWVVFDCMVEADLGLAETLRWLAGRWRFPVVTPRGLLLDFAGHCGLHLARSFEEVFGESSVRSFLFRKAGAAAGTAGPTTAGPRRVVPRPAEERR